MGSSQLAAALDDLHRAPVPADATRLDDDGVLSIYFGSMRQYRPAAHDRCVALAASVVPGMTMARIHGDATVVHNSLWSNAESLTGVIDPGVVEVGPPVLDWAWAEAMALERGWRTPQQYESDLPDELNARELSGLVLIRRLSDALAWAHPAGEIAMMRRALDEVHPSLVREVDVDGW